MQKLFHNLDCKGKICKRSAPFEVNQQIQCCLRVPSSLPINKAISFLTEERSYEANDIMDMHDALLGNKPSAWIS